MKDNIIVISVTINILLVILLTIAIMFWKDCYNYMNDIEKELIQCENRSGE